jgi:hypothetical protein
VWRDLPAGHDGSVGNKTLWWSDRFSAAEHEDFDGNAALTVTAERLDGSAHEVVADGGVPSFNHVIKNFMLVGLVLPDAGCGKVTARYQGAELTYVLRVDG